MRKRKEVGVDQVMLFVGGAECRRGALLLQTRLPEVLGNVHGDVEKGQVGDGHALTLEAGRRGGGWGVRNEVGDR